MQDIILFKRNSSVLDQFFPQINSLKNIIFKTGLLLLFLGLVYIENNQRILNIAFFEKGEREESVFLNRFSAIRVYPQIAITFSCYQSACMALNGQCAMINVT